jgi:hypothetical protein
MKKQPCPDQAVVGFAADRSGQGLPDLATNQEAAGNLAIVKAHGMPTLVGAARQWIARWEMG